MDLQPGTPIAGVPVDVYFISCTNGRYRRSPGGSGCGTGRHVADSIKAFVVPAPNRWPGRRKRKVWTGYFKPRASSGRSLVVPCVGMNPDRLEGRQISASSSNRNFKGRQGSASGQALLMSPAMVAAAAVPVA